MNPVTKDVEERLGKFIFDPHDSVENKNVQSHKPIELSNGAIFSG